MASRINGITVEIGGDTTKLQNALKSVNSSLKSMQSRLCKCSVQYVRAMIGMARRNLDPSPEWRM